MRLARVTVLTLLALTLLAAPLAAEAQQARVFHVGVVIQGGPSYYVAVDGLRDGLREFGLEDGKQLILHVHDTHGDLRAVAAAARTLEAQKVDLIYSWSTSVSLAVAQATQKVPIVFYAGTDPVAAGLVGNFRKARRASDWGARLDHGPHSEAPRAPERDGAETPTGRGVLQSREPRRSAGLEACTGCRPAPQGEPGRAPCRLDRGVTGRLARAPAQGGGCVLPRVDAMVTSQTPLVLEATMAKRLPTMFQDRQSVVQGGLASYGVDYYAVGRLSAKQVRRILLGADPGDLPIEQIERIPFVINLKTAKALGLTIPPAVLARADEIIHP